MPKCRLHGISSHTSVRAHMWGFDAIVEAISSILVGGPHEHVGPDGPKSSFRPNHPVRPEMVAESLVATLGLRKGHYSCKLRKYPWWHRGRITVGITYVIGGSATALSSKSAKVGFEDHDVIGGSATALCSRSAERNFLAYVKSDVVMRGLALSNSTWSPILK
ncbi:hypothetical protein EPI10_024032 [Gossypium australe]|uniref:Uncharacterized protein n=1 Tax=Gossypium australe TaxID=47621 RepID=A0A5B6VWQ2_9ROSI|nr:hypothetical protein EPI10_024032 [Gossypium australe]